MNSPIKRYPVRHPLLSKYIKFYWELHIDKAQFNHKIIPQRNINIRFNLSSTPHFIQKDTEITLLENVYFQGLHSRFANARLKLDGHVDILGICFKSDGIYPFLKIPVSEFRNQIVGASEIGFNIAGEICEKLRESHGTAERLLILENELLLILASSPAVHENFHLLFEALNQDNTVQLAEFCNRQNIGLRQLERMYCKYVGLPASTYITLNRFHKSLNQLFNSGYSKLSDLAYDNGYFDQMHFIKEFKRFTGNTPGKFVNENDSILQINK
ncbi:MAG TPA: AraC family transcriptional regulator [Bacteroidales bacterium]|nr:AraC family transcriptional regulator [Bacteroidales bacterium]